MHKIRRKAHRAGWYDHNDGSWGSNFITGRIQTRVPFDDEQQLHFTQTDDNATYSRHELAGSGLPVTVSTFPAPTSSQERPGISSSLISSDLAERPPSENTTLEVVPENSIQVQPKRRASRNRTAWRQRSKRYRILHPFHRHKEQEIDVASIADDTKCEEIRPHFTIASQIKATFGVWLNVLLPFIPAGFVVSYTHQNPVAIFVVNFIAIIPMASTVSFSVDNLSLYLGDVLGGLLSMTFSNVVQLISSIFLLKSRQIPVLRSSLLGAVLQNLLVMTGLAFLCGGFNRFEQHFNMKMAQSTGMLLLLAVFSITVPTVSQISSNTSSSGIVAQSRGTAVVVIISYVLYLVFTLRTHADEFVEPSQKAPKRSSRRKEAGEASKGLAVIGAASGAATAGGGINSKYLVCEDEEEDTIPVISRLFAALTLILSTTLLAFNTQFATDSVQGIMQQHHISSMFMGIVILPILSNDPMTVLMAIRDKMDLSILLTLGRCLQAALMVIPLIVLIAWGMGIDDMNLDFDGFSIASMFASILIVTYVIQQGRSNWLTGALFLKVFVIIALASFYIE